MNGIIFNVFSTSSILPLEDLEMYHYYEFECDGDSKKVIIRRKESE